MALLLSGCSLFSNGQEISEGDANETPTVPETSLTLAPTHSFGYDGPRSLEERILASNVIVRVRFVSATSTAVSASTYLGTRYLARLEFTFSVLEYLKGSGADSIVAVWDAAPLYDTRQEAQTALLAIRAGRDTQWDDHEAILLFRQDYQDYPASTQQTDKYYLSWGGSWSISDDGYSIASIHDKLWLPAEAAIGAPDQPIGDHQRFLLDVPPATGAGPTITLGEMKARIAAVTAKLDASGGSEEYGECVRLTYLYERQLRHYRQAYPSRSGSNVVGDPPSIHEFNSGLAAGEPLYEDGLGFGPTAEKRTRFWLDGGNADLFNVEYDILVPHDLSGDGVNDSVNFTRRVIAARPIPKGVYSFQFNIRSHFFSLCDGYTTRYGWTVTVTAPDGVLHEAFFDPVTIGSAVAADNTNGVLKPATFADANGATTTIERIAWEAGAGESGAVKVTISPHEAVAGQALDVITLDGSEALTLNVADATLDAASDTLSWPVASQPWQSGDKLMLRIRDVDQ